MNMYCISLKHLFCQQEQKIKNKNGTVSLNMKRSEMERYANCKHVFAVIINSKISLFYLKNAGHFLRKMLSIEEIKPLEF